MQVMASEAQGPAKAAEKFLVSVSLLNEMVLPDGRVLPDAAFFCSAGLSLVGSFITIEAGGKEGCAMLAQTVKNSPTNKPA